MRLTAKLIVAFMVGNILLAAIYGYLAVQREVRIFERTAMEEAEIIGKAMSDVWRRRGRSEMIEVLRQVADGNLSMRIRWVRFDSRPEEDSFPSAGRAPGGNRVGAARGSRGDRCGWTVLDDSLLADRRGRG